VAAVDQVEAQLRAYNARDVDAFVAQYAPDAVITDGKGAVLMQGGAAIRAEYGPFFEAYPELRAAITSRIAIGDYVIDEELIHGWQPEPVRAVAVYHVADGLIDRVTLLE
jgi:hypothetical protein